MHLYRSLRASLQTASRQGSSEILAKMLGQSPLKNETNSSGRTPVPDRRTKPIVFARAAGGSSAALAGFQGVLH
eukprot:2835326-Pyramimonas_sp.AAC.1